MMIEIAIPFSQGDEKVIERVIDEMAVGINHMILPQGTGLPVHNANAPVYMVVARGQITLVLDDQEAHTYTAGNIVTIPYQTRMDVQNTGEAVTELFVVKAPGPRSMT